MSNGTEETRPEDIRPFVRYVRFVTEKNIRPYSDKCVFAYDHRLFVGTEGTCTVWANNIPYRLRAGNALFIRSGVPYRYEAEGAFRLIGFNFDFSNRHADLALPIPPDGEEAFCRENLTEPGELPAFRSVSPIVFVIAPRLTETAILTEREYRHRRLYAGARLSALTADLLLCFFRAVAEEKLPRSASPVQEIAAYVRTHCAEKCDNITIGKVFGYHPNYLNRIWKSYYGGSLHQYMLRCRMEEAIALLETTLLSIAEVGQAVGFPDPAHFSRTFRRITGRTPGAFRMVS